MNQEDPEIGGSLNLARLRRQAEKQMRRNLDDARPCKRPRHQTDRTGTFLAVDRYRYAVVEDLEAGAKGFLITCNFRKEKSATREATHLLRRYLPDHLFRAPEPNNYAAADQHGVLANSLVADEGEAKGNGGDADAAGNAAGVAADGGGGGSRGSTGAGKEDDCEDEDDSLGGLEEQPGNGSDLGGPVGQQCALSLAKVGCRGVVLLLLSPAAATAVDPARVVEAMLDDCEAGCLQPPMHCQRITPLDATCTLNPSGLSRAVAQAAAAHTRRVLGGAAGGPRPQTCSASTAAGTVDVSAAVTIAAANESAAPATDPSDKAAAAAGAVAAADGGVGVEVEAAEAPVGAGHEGAGSNGSVEPFTYAIVYHSRFTEPTGPEADSAQPQPQAKPREAPGGNGDEGVNEDEGGAGGGGDKAESRCAGGGDGGSQGADGDGGEAGSPLDRGRIISLVAAGMARAFGDTARVSLKKPQVAVLVEAVPVAGRQLAGLTVLGQQMFVAKGKLLVKPLIKAKVSAGR